MDAAMMETSLSIPMPPAVAGSSSDAISCGKCRRWRFDTIDSSMADAGENIHGCQNNSDSEEDRCSDTDFETSKLGTRE